MQSTSGTTPPGGPWPLAKERPGPDGGTPLQDGKRRA